MLEVRNDIKEKLMDGRNHEILSGYSMLRKQVLAHMDRKL